MDKTPAEFESYLAGMSWRLAVPFALSGAVSGQLGVWGIPALLIVERATGAVITRDGASLVQSDPAGFPWRT